MRNRKIKIVITNPMSSDSMGNPGIPRGLGSGVGSGDGEGSGVGVGVGVGVGTGSGSCSKTNI